MHYRTSAVIASLFLFAATLSAETFDIRFEPTSARVDIRYYLTGDFGGYGGSSGNRDSGELYRIPVEHDGQRAKSIKAILYAPGCQIEILSVDLLSDAKRSSRFQCRPLPTIELVGKILPVPENTSPSNIDIYYEAFWDHPFFGIADGMVSSFRVATAALEADGNFRIRVPNFSKDGISNRMGGAFLRVFVVDRQSGNVASAELVRTTKLDGATVVLKVYGVESEITFQASQ